MISTFMYHDIRDSEIYKKRYDLKSFLTIDYFKKQLDLITKRYKVIKTNEIPNYINTDIECAVLTFDDGLKDHFNVTEVLVDYGITGTFLIPTLPVIGGKMINSHKIQFIMACEDEGIISRKNLGMVNTSKKETYETYSITTVKDNWWSKDMIFITNYLRYGKNNKEITNALFEEIVTKNEKKFCDDFYLSEDNIREMVSHGMEIGAHGYTSDILNKDNALEEITKSIDYIKNFYDEEIIFSYPNGVFNDTIIEHLKEKKCTFAYTTEKKEIYNNDLLRIPRFDAPQTILT